MKLFTGWIVSAGLVLTATAANAQMSAPSRYIAASDVGAPYSAMPPDAGQRPLPQGPVGPGYGYGQGYGYGPPVMPPQEVYEVVRESGFSPLGIPHQRGFAYFIAVVDRRGDEGRLVIDGRDGRIIRYMPAYRMDGYYREGVPPAYGPRASLPPVTEVPPPAPKMASRTPVPMPKASPQRPAEVKPVQPAQQSAAVQAKPADAQAQMPPQPSPVVAEAKPTPPAVVIQPTQAMPKAQGLE